MAGNQDVKGAGLSAKVQESRKNWLEWDKNETTLNEIRGLSDQDLEERLSSRLTFGTAGIRGAMGAGFSRMNDLVVIQTSQGLAAYAAEVFSDATNKSIVIGFDGRHNSKKFAQLAALAMLQKGFRVYLFGRVCPTPFVSFGVSHLKSCVGIMVTASHNPKEDNGYKVYWSNSAQIIPPHDKKIQSSILENLKPWDGAWDLKKLDDNTMVTNPLDEVWAEYNRRLVEKSLENEQVRKSNVKLTFTPMHGVGQDFMVKAFEVAGLEPFLSVKEQKDTDPDFSTVKFPNPEEGKSSLNLAIKTAEAGGSTVIIANDPDSDRLAVAEKRECGGWTVFNGNEIGALLGWWMMFTNHGSVDSDCYMLSSTVSSKFIKSMAEKDGFSYIETLTGFKWMGNKAIDLINDGKKVLFAYEEAIGFMCGDVVLDKDGISAGVRAAEMVNYLANREHTLQQKLQELYKQYGYHVSFTSYYICRDPEKTEKIFADIRARCSREEVVLSLTLKDVQLETLYNAGENPITVKVVAYRDLTVGYDSEQPDKKPILPVSSSSQMITFKFDNGLILTIRGSGTEPKLKYYADFKVSSDRIDAWPRYKADVEAMVTAIVKDLLGSYAQELTHQSALVTEN